MSAVLDFAESGEAAFVDEGFAFFAPAPTDLVNGLIVQYQFMREKVERVGAVMNGPDLAGALHYFPSTRARMTGTCLRARLSACSTCLERSPT
jgi:hypothetical protein